MGISRLHRWQTRLASSESRAYNSAALLNAFICLSFSFLSILKSGRFSTRSSWWFEILSCARLLRHHLRHLLQKLRSQPSILICLAGTSYCYCYDCLSSVLYFYYSLTTNLSSWLRFLTFLDSHGSSFLTTSIMCAAAEQLDTCC